MGIPYAQSYSATLTGSVVKVVACEQCRNEYVYSMERTAVGSGTSILFLDNDGAKQRAARDAEVSLHKQLAAECDAVPCPSCGWYQPEMQTKLRGEYHGWMFLLGGFLLGVAFIAGLVLVANLLGPHAPAQSTLLISWSVFGGGLLLGFGLIILRKSLARGYDPNLDDLNARKEIALQRAMLRADFEQELAASRAAAQAAPPADPWAFLKQDGK